VCRYCYYSALLPSLVLRVTRNVLTACLKKGDHCKDPKSPSARASSAGLAGKRCARCLRCEAPSLRVPPPDRATQRTRRAVQLGWPRGCRGKWPCISPDSPSRRKADQSNQLRRPFPRGAWERSEAQALNLTPAAETPKPTPPQSTPSQPNSQSPSDYPKTDNPITPYTPASDKTNW